MISLGRHIVAELYNCSHDKIDDVDYVEKSMIKAADKAGATIINSTFHHFSPYGVSGVIVIQESHISIHCWPEYQYASIDIYTCGDSVDPWIAYEQLKMALGASHGSTMELNRGQHHLLAPKGIPTKTSKTVKKQEGIARSRNIWFTERNENIALSLKHSGDRLFIRYSDFQKIEIYQTEALGRILVLDGNIACAEEDEYVYHEMIAHVPVFAHGSAEKILIVGGGDGGTAREILKHQHVAQIDLVEIDEDVIDAAREFLPELSCGLADSRVRVRIQDGVQFASTCADSSYDLVIIDSDDPDGPSKGLFTRSFYSDIYRILKDDGIMVTQSESPRFNQQIFKDVFQCYGEIFGNDNVHAYLMYLPSFPSGMWSFSFSSKGSVHPFANLDKINVDQFARENSLLYYSYEIHRSSFVLPQFVEQILK